ncbi:MAG: branched-chain amino acid ABC transporter substrate-binding protein [Solirubrobacterales bacterium]|nr:branched-chain amino acid ABC transporter substrate-binding protein [Solirubrobacterales bacterium]
MSQRRSGLLAAGVAVVALSFGLAACGGSDDDGGGSGSGTGANEVSIYSSFPLQGASRPTGISLQNGVQLALEQAGNKAGGVDINFVPLDDSTAQAGEWTPEAESANAKKAVQDDSAVAYIGTYNSGAAAISIPILNEAGLAMLSPGNTAVGLTSDAPGADTGIGEPDIYYPTGERNYARIVPKDTVQGAALAGLMDEDGCTKVGVLNDNEVYGKGLAANVIDAGSKFDYEFADGGAIDTQAANFRSTAKDFASQGVDCFVFGGITASNAVQLYKDMGAAMPDAKLYGPDGVGDSDFAGGLPADVASRTKVTVPTLSQEAYGKEGAKFFKDYAAKFGEDENKIGPFAIYGYEAGKLILDVLDRAEDPTNRADVVKAMFDTKDRNSILGKYSIDENGDTTLTDYGVFDIKNGDLTFDEKISAKRST